jgi:cytidylate kinase
MHRAHALAAGKPRMCSRSQRKAAAMQDLNLRYLAREAEARAIAGEQVLENVRQKHLTAAATWAALAHSARKMTELRARRLVERSAAT